MKVITTAKIITAFVYDKKDKATGEPNGQKGVMLNLLIDENLDSKLSGKVIAPFVEPETYRGIIDFSLCNKLDEVEVEMDISFSGKKEFYKLFNLQRVEKKK